MEEAKEKENVYTKKIKYLLQLFAEQPYMNKTTTEDPKNQDILDTCTALWKLDYKCEVIDNTCGVICDSYPSKIILPLYELGPRGEVLPNSCPVTLTTQNHSPDIAGLSSSACDATKSASLRDLTKFEETPTFASVVSGPSIENGTPCSSSDNQTEATTNSVSENIAEILTEVRSHLKDARRARCRYRVPLPVILCKGKYISRAGTLSGFLDVYRKNLVLYALDTEPRELKEAVSAMQEETSSSFYDVEAARNADIRLLKILGMSQIIDLMVEQKKVKFFFNITSSEKADSKDRYYEFRIASMPYPGCEFFVNFTKNRLSSEGLSIDWNSPVNNAELSLPDGFTGQIPSHITKDWENYKTWDLRRMTEYYLRYILGYITEEHSKEKGLLIHCISGWDRTPLFISLLRLSLWADGLVHSSLDATQMLYFTLAYDWYLFGHQLPTRLGQKENIMYFCFEFLEVIFKDYSDFRDYRNRHPSAESETAESLDRGVAGGFDTPSSFGSTNSIDLASSHPSGSQPSSQQQNVKIYTSSSQCAVQEPHSNWPFNKENGFTFDGISENNSVSTMMGGLSVSSENGHNGSDLSKRVSPSRSPLKERNRGTPSKRCRKVSGEELCASASSSASPLSSSSAENKGGFKTGSGGSFRRSNLNGLLREFTGKRSRKNSSTEPPARFSVGSDTVDIDTSDISGTSDSESGSVCTASVSNPVAVPGSNRSRHDSSESSIGSWQFLSPTDITSAENHRSSKTSLTFNMEESTQTIQEEATPPSSLESSQSIIVFNRKRRLAEVKDTFYKLYGEVTSLQQEQYGLVDMLSNMVQRVVT